MKKLLACKYKFYILCNVQFIILISFYLLKANNPQGLKENKEIARRGGKAAGETRKSIEAETGKSVITNKNAAQLNAIVTNMIEAVAKDKTEK